MVLVEQRSNQEFQLVYFELNVCFSSNNTNKISTGLHQNFLRANAQVSKCPTIYCLFVDARNCFVKQRHFPNIVRTSQLNFESN